MVLLAVALIGFLTVAVQNSGQNNNSNIDDETLIIRASEVQRYASELERAARFALQNGVSQDDIRFAHPDNHPDYGDLAADGDPREQVFHREGGGANYRNPPSGINDGSAWEFYAGTHIPGIGRDDRTDLVVVLPHVTQDFCDTINRINGQDGIPEDPGTAAASGTSPGECVNLGELGRFDDSQQFYANVNSMDEAATSFEHDPNTSAVRPALQACVTCSADTNSANGANDERHFYHVLFAR